MKYYDEETVNQLLAGLGPRELRFCPSIEIPDSHGRIIDIDKFIDIIKSEYYPDFLVENDVELFFQLINDEADVIVEPR